MKIFGNIVDIHNRSIYKGSVEISGKKIVKINKQDNDSDVFILPGLIDSHVHIESSMVIPERFADEAKKHGTIGVVSDPHEIANVLGLSGVEFMIRNGKKSPLYFWFGAPSCVPATDFETSGATIDAIKIRTLFSEKKVKFLSEMMNFPGVINGDKTVIEKLNVAKEFHMPIDGHAPGLTGAGLVKYAAAGISTDHECSNIREALEKISLGMKILLREGSAARNLNALKELYMTHTDKIMLCSDDIHPEMLIQGHINKLVSRLIGEGYNLFDVLRSCTINPALHYNLEAGLLRPGDAADLIVVEDLSTMEVLETWIKGKKVFERGKDSNGPGACSPINKFNCSAIRQEDIRVKNGGKKIRVIEAFDGELLTRQIKCDTGDNNPVETQIKNDILKIVVKDRYFDSPPAVGFIKGFGLKKGAIASSVAHDSHNIISIGCNDQDIADAINEIVKLKGGLAVADKGTVKSMALSIGGIMSDKSCTEVAMEYEQLSQLAGEMGCSLKAPFMTLSFMALLVIPEIKISDKGIFDGNTFSFIPLFES